VEEGFLQKVSSKGKGRDRFLGDARYYRRMGNTRICLSRAQTEAGPTDGKCEEGLQDEVRPCARFVALSKWCVCVHGHHLLEKLLDFARAI
jgi:hypothetical protein